MATLQQAAPARKGGRPPEAARRLAEYATAKEVACVLKVSVATVYRYCRNGDLPHVKLPGRLGRVRIAPGWAEVFFGPKGN